MERQHQGLGFRGLRRCELPTEAFVGLLHGKAEQKSYTIYTSIRA